jgi:hypothetical protein
MHGVLEQVGKLSRGVHGEYLARATPAQLDALAGSVAR